MSGSSITFTGRGSSADTSCFTLELDTQLSSPKEDIVDRMQPGDALEVVLHTTQTFSTVAVLWRGELAGGVASPEITSLQNCLREGVIYVATVMEKSGGEVRIRIYPYKP